MNTNTNVDSTNVVAVDRSEGTDITLLPFHLSVCVGDLDSTRHFYRDVLGLEERRASDTAVHFDFYGSQLTLHEVEGFSAKNLQREIDAEDVPVPHFGVVLPFAEWERVAERLTAHGVNFVCKPRLRHLSKGHEQFVLFLEDPSGNGIEIKSFTKVAMKQWA